MSSPPVKPTKKQRRAQRRSDKQQAKVARASPAAERGLEWKYLTPPLLLALIVFGQTLGFDFVNWDDDVNVLENRNVLFFDLGGIFTETVIGNYNPLPILTFAIEYALVGTEAWLYHANNLLLHLVNVVLVYLLGRRLRLTALPACLLASLFAIHPLRVESVAWITERKDVLFSAFYFAALLVYERRRQSGRHSGWSWGVAALFALALFSKIQAVSLPLSMICLDYLRQGRLQWREVLAKAPYFSMSLAMGLAGIYFLGSEGSLDDATTYTFLQRLAVGAYAYTVYLVKLVVPYEMSPLYPYPSVLPWYIYGAFATTGLAIAIMVWAYFRRHAAVAFSLAFFTVNVMFMLQVLGAGQGFIADRFTYVGYFGLFWGLAYGLQQLSLKRVQRTAVIRGACVAVLLVFAAVSFRQTRIWQNGGTLWAHTRALYPKASTPHGNYGQYVRDQGQLDLALEAFSAAIAADPNSGAYYNSRGKLHFDNGRIEEAIRDYTAGIAADPELGEVYVNRGAANAQSGRYDQALADINRGLELDPENINGYSNRSLLYFTTGRLKEAIADYTTILQMQPERHEYWHERGLARGRMGDLDGGRADLNLAIRLAPDAATQDRYRQTLSNF